MPEADLHTKPLSLAQSAPQGTFDAHISDLESQGEKELPVVLGVIGLLG